MSQHPADEVSATIIPTRWVGPIRITGDLDESVEVPLATYTRVSTRGRRYPSHHY
jgi:hypothetical protein